MIPGQYNREPEPRQLAHDFNEELTIILNATASAAGMIGSEHPARGALVELKHAAERCAELARRLLLQ